MLQDIRQNVKGPAAKIIVGLIVISFSLFGIESILLGGGSDSVAEVNGEEVTPQELQQAVNTQKRRLIAMLGDNLDPAMLDDQRLGAQALESLIRRKLMMQSAREMNLAVSEREIGALVGSMEQFQSDGVFSPDIYKSALASAGYTPGYFKQVLADDMLVSQMGSGLFGSEFITPAEMALNAQIMSEQRDVRYLTIPLERFTAMASVSDAQVEEFYSNNQSDFLSSESVDLSYIELGPKDFFQPVDEQSLMEAYELAIAETQFQPQNRVSHILFEAGGELTVQERISQAQAMLAAGADFAEVAAEFSDDIGSVNRGGDLGYSSGDAFPDAMEAAIAVLEPGTVSEPVETGSGLHLILVTERNSGEAPTLEEMRGSLQESIQLEKARVELVRTVEILKDLSFNADDLKGPAEEMGLAVTQKDGVSRNQQEGLFANARLLEAAFSEDVLEAGHNSEVIELAADKYVVLRVRAHQPVDVKPLEEVRENVVAAIEAENTLAAIAREAQEVLGQLRGGETIEQLATSNGYGWQVELNVGRGNTTVAPEVLRRVFELPAPGKDQQSMDYILLQTGDAVVIELARVIPGDLTALSGGEQGQLRQQLSAESGSLLNSEFESGLRLGADITTL